MPTAAVGAALSRKVADNRQHIAQAPYDPGPEIAADNNQNVSTTSLKSKRAEKKPQPSTTVIFFIRNMILFRLNNISNILLIM